VAGHGVLAIDAIWAFFTGLGLIILGVGMLKPNMTAAIEVNDYSNPKAVLVSIKNILENQKGAS
jgi:uncharacterized membrane protein YesL